MAKTKKRGKIIRPFKTISLNVVIPVHLSLYKSEEVPEPAFDMDMFESDMIDSDYDFEHIVEAAVTSVNQDRFEGSHSVGPIYVEEVSGVDRLIEEMRRKIKAKMKTLERDIHREPHPTETVRSIKRGKN